MLIANLAYFILSCIFLIVSGSLLVRSLTKISRFLRISEFSAAFIIMAVATSVPELFVGISSALEGNPSLSLGNVIGASIIDLTLITGILVLLGGKINTEKIGKDHYYMMASIILLIGLYLMGSSLSRVDGIFLILLFTLTVTRNIKRRTKYTKKLENKLSRWKLVLNSFIFFLALAILFISSKYAVIYASNLSIDLQLPKIILGLFLLSIATTLPELVFGITAIKLKHKEMSIGDQIGTVIANITLILGIVAVISPITAELKPFITSSIFLFISAFLFITFAKTGKKLESIEGISLILIYILFVMIELFIR